MIKILMFFIFHLALKPLIKANYAQRSAGDAPGEWYWADDFAARYGYFVSIEVQDE